MALGSISWPKIFKGHYHKIIYSDYFPLSGSFIIYMGFYGGVTKYYPENEMQ